MCLSPSHCDTVVVSNWTTNQLIFTGLVSPPARCSPPSLNLKVLHNGDQFLFLYFLFCFYSTSFSFHFDWFDETRDFRVRPKAKCGCVTPRERQTYFSTPLTRNTSFATRPQGKTITKTKNKKQAQGMGTVHRTEQTSVSVKTYLTPSMFGKSRTHSLNY